LTLLLVQNFELLQCNIAVTDMNIIL